MMRHNFVLAIPLVFVVMSSNAALVSADATTQVTVFPQWTNEQLISIFADQKPAVEAGGPLRTYREDWAAARARISGNKTWSSWLQTRQSVVDEWISLQNDKLEWIAGWAHNYVEPDGSTRKWLVTDPIKDDLSDAASKLRGGWVFYFRSTNVDRALEAAQLYKLTRNVKYAAWAKSQLFFYASSYELWPLQTWNGNARMMSQSLDEAVLATKLVDVVRLLNGYLTAEDKAFIYKGLFSPMATNLLTSYQGVNNISLWHAVAITLIGWEFENDGLVEQGLNGPSGVRKILSTGVTRELMWYEGSLSYQYYMIRSMLPLFAGAAIRSKESLIYREQLGLQDMLFSQAQFRFSNNVLPALGDVTSQLSAPETSLSLESYRVLPSLNGYQLASSRYNWDTLLDPPSLPRPFSDLPVVVSKSTPESQMGFLKVGPWQSYIRYGQSIVNHAHPDAGNFDLYWNDTVISADPGTVSYGAPIHSEYFSTPVAHNIILSNGRGQIKLTKGIVTAFEPTEGLISLSIPDYNADVSLANRYEVSGATYTVNTAANLKEKGKEAQIGYLLNLNCTIAEIQGAVKKFDVELPNLSGFKYWDNTAGFDMPKNWATTIQCGGEAFNLSVTTSSPHRLYIASVPATPIPLRRTGLLMMLNTSDSASFNVAFTHE